jgi:hypothetical protein
VNHSLARAECPRGREAGPGCRARPAAQARTLTSGTTPGPALTSKHVRKNRLGSLPALGVAWARAGVGVQRPGVQLATRPVFLVEGRNYALPARSRSPSPSSANSSHGSYFTGSRDYLSGRVCGGVPGTP